MHQEWEDLHRVTPFQRFSGEISMPIPDRLPPQLRREYMPASHTPWEKIAFITTALTGSIHVRGMCTKCVNQGISDFSKRFFYQNPRDMAGKLELHI